MNTVKKTLITLFSLLLLASCKDDNKGFDEYYNSMGNNPAMVIPWMQDLVKDLRQTQAVIQAYDYNNETYYTLQVYKKVGSKKESPYTIYESDEGNKTIFYHSDNILETNQKTDSLYFDFQDNSTFLYLIWKNTPNDGSDIEF